MAAEQQQQLFHDFSRNLEGLVGAIKQFGDRGADETYLGKLHGFDVIIDCGCVKISHETFVVTLGQPFDSTIEFDLTDYLLKRNLHIDWCGAKLFKPEGESSDRRAICVQTNVNSSLDKESLYNAVVLLSSALRNYKFPVKVEIRADRRIEEFT